MSDFKNKINKLTRKLGDNEKLSIFSILKKENLNSSDVGNLLQLQSIKNENSINAKVIHSKIDTLLKAKFVTKSDDDYKLDCVLIDRVSINTLSLIDKLKLVEERLERAEAIKASPRYTELLSYTKGITAKQRENKQNLVTARDIRANENLGKKGDDYSVVPATYEKNYMHDFTIGEYELSRFSKGKADDKLLMKFEDDLEMLDNNPEYAINIDEDIYYDTDLTPTNQTYDSQGNIVTTDFDSIHDKYRKVVVINDDNIETLLRRVK